MFYPSAPGAKRLGSSSCDDGAQRASIATSGYIRAYSLKNSATCYARNLMIFENAVVKSVFGGVGGCQPPNLSVAYGLISILRHPTSYGFHHRLVIQARNI